MSRQPKNKTVSLSHQFCTGGISYFFQKDFYNYVVGDLIEELREPFLSEGFDLTVLNNLKNVSSRRNRPCIVFDHELRNVE